jgi:hypothetical protein
MAVSVRESRTLNTRRPFSRADARKAGIGLRALLSARFHKIFYDCYVASTIPITTELRAEAALGISPPGSYVSHFTAAQLWGAVVPEVSEVHVTVPGEAGRTVRRGSQGSCRRRWYGHDPHPNASDHDTCADVP